MFSLEELCLIGTLLSHMSSEKHDYRDSYLYQAWSGESGYSEELIATENRIAKRIVALVEYVRRALLRSEESCLEVMNLGHADQLANSVTKAVCDLSCDTVVQMLDAVQSNALEIEVCLKRAGATISEKHNLAQLFSKRSRLRSA